MGLKQTPNGDFEKGRQLFKETCAQCHTVAKNGRHMLGPNLHGVVGRGAAQAQGYYYTEAAKTKGIVWTKEALFDFLCKPFEFLPGTRMVFFGLQKESDRADIITYLEDSSK